MSQKQHSFLVFCIFIQGNCSVEIAGNQFDTSQC
ncbi:hypothetical protein EYB48_14795 [Undibacterium sp. B2R-29]|nr:hypothetical protein [Undibacterium crateris]